MIRRCRLAIVAFVLCALALGLPSAVQSQEPTPSLPPDVLVTTAVPISLTSVIAPLDASPRTGGVPGLQDQLAQIAAADRAGDAARLATFAAVPHVDIKNKRARVILEMETSPNAVPVGQPTVETVTGGRGAPQQIQHGPPVAIRPDLAQSIAVAGASYETAYGNSVQVLAPLSRLEALSKISGVRLVRLPLPAQPSVLPPLTPSGMPSLVGTLTSEGVNLTNANDWHSAGYNGSGVKIAIFDFGFTGWNARQTAGDLPSGAQLVLKDFSSAYEFGPPGTDFNEHGTACAEIAYDMAPGSTIYLYAWNTEVELGNAVNDYITNVSGQRVASMSIAYVNAGPYDGTGSINSIIDSAQAAGIYFTVSAGNSQKEHHSWTSARYSTTDFVAFGSGNVNPIGPDPDHMWSIPAWTTLQIFLEWNDWNAGRTGNANHIDYDLYLYRLQGINWTQEASSQNRQCGGGTAPLEAIGFTVSQNNSNYAVVIQRYSNASCPNNFGHWMELFTFNGFYQSGQGSVPSFGYNNPCNSLTIPSDGDSAITVGATFWNEDSTSPLYGLETFSSLGPRNAAGGSNPGAAVNKPDVVAPDGVSSAAYGASNGSNYASPGSGFWGTSAASPHAAGLAAVVWSYRPSYSLAELRAFIQSRATAKGNGGTCGGASTPNNRFGSGRINLTDNPTAVTISTFTSSSGENDLKAQVLAAWTPPVVIGLGIVIALLVAIGILCARES